MSHSKLLVALFTLLTPMLLSAQHAHSSPSKADKATPKKTDAEKIANAMSAAPPEIAKQATIMDWGATMADAPRELKAGTNGWVCFPNSPSEFGTASLDDPMCLDKQWQSWANAWTSKKTPEVTATGIAYMLRGDRGASNTDPFATERTATNEWVVSPPHIMILYQDLKMLDAFPTDPMSGGPWVMWKGTPYAHLMVPVSETKSPSMPKK